MAELVDSHMRPGPWQKVGYFRKVRPLIARLAGRRRLVSRLNTDAWDTLHLVSLSHVQLEEVRLHHARPYYCQRFMALCA